MVKGMLEEEIKKRKLNSKVYTKRMEENKFLELVENQMTPEQIQENSATRRN
jgi:hypothetical protein